MARPDAGCNVNAHNQSGRITADTVLKFETDDRHCVERPRGHRCYCVDSLQLVHPQSSQRRLAVTAPDKP